MKKKKSTPRTTLRNFSRKELALKESDLRDMPIGSSTAGSLQRIADALEAMNARAINLEKTSMHGLYALLKAAPGMPAALKKELASILKTK